MILEKEHKFGESYSLGESFEEFLVKDIQEKKYPKAHRFISENIGENSYYDIIIPELSNNGLFGIECKNDVKGFDTPNIFIEVAQDGRKSGLAITKSKIWIQGDTELIYIVEVETIKNKLKELYFKEIKKLQTIPNYKTDLSNIRYFKNYPIKQEGYTKYMDFFLIPKNVFKTFCLEVSKYDEIQYNF